MVYFMWVDNRRWTFRSDGESLNDGFVSYKHAAFSSQDVNWWTGWTYWVHTCFYIAHIFNKILHVITSVINLCNYISNYTVDTILAP